MEKEIMESVKFIIPIMLAVIGWGIGHCLSTKRDIKNKRLEQRIIHLIEAFNDLNLLRSYPETLDIKKIGELLIQISNNIELFGSIEQVKMFKILSKSIAENQGIMKDVDKLINDLRDDLRSQLELEKSLDPVSYFKISKKGAKK